jgi:hypothetical protein
MSIRVPLDESIVPDAIEAAATTATTAAATTVLWLRARPKKALN